MKSTLLKMAGFTALIFSLTACGNLDKSDRRVGAGAVIGAAAGYMITGDATGTLAGAAAGGLVGNQYDKHKSRKKK